MSRYPAVCPHVIERPPMRMQWDQLTLVHWRYDPAEVQALLPSGVTVETFDGSAWVGLVPFQMRVELPFLPQMASILHFAETNVRTYVSGTADQPGVWFFSLEASSLPAVVAARATYGVPYFWSDMTLDHAGDRLRYVTQRRRWPRPAGARSVVEVDVGQPYGSGEATELDHFLTARWALYGRYLGRITHAEMHHEPWPLHHAELIECQDELVVASGLSAPQGEPLVHYSPSVTVRCGWPGGQP